MSLERDIIAGLAMMGDPTYLVPNNGGYHPSSVSQDTPDLGWGQDFRGMNWRASAGRQGRIARGSGRRCPGSKKPVMTTLGGRGRYS